MGRAIAEGNYPVIARFRRYLDFAAGENVIGLSDMEGEGGAHTVVLQGLRDGWTERASELRVEPAALFFDGQIFPREEVPLYRDNAECAFFAALPLEEKRRRLRFFRGTVLEHAAPLSMAVALDPARRGHFRGAFAEALAARFLEGASACAAGEYARAASLLQGVGYGLTPSGDDFLCGAMYALHFASACGLAPEDMRGAGDADDGRAADSVHGAGAVNALALAIEAGLSRSAFMSRTFLRDALAGRWPRRLRDAVESLGRDGGEYASIRSAVLRALQHGASSGADLLSGFILIALCFGEIKRSVQNEAKQEEQHEAGRGAA